MIGVGLPPPPWIAAHRGALPLLENTIPSLERAVAEGADLLEFDVQATADEALVLLHDSDLGRLAGRPDLVVERTAARNLLDIELCDPATGGRGRIPTLSALLSSTPGDYPINIELKVQQGDRGRLAALALEATAGRQNVLFSSFDSPVLRALRQRAPTARLAPLARRWTPAMARLGEELGAWSLHVGAGVAHARAAGERRPLLVYTVNDAARARRLLSAGASGLFTDRPGGLRAELGAPGESGVLSRAYRGR